VPPTPLGFRRCRGAAGTSVDSPWAQSDCAHRREFRFVVALAMQGVEEGVENKHYLSAEPLFPWQKFGMLK
jgi:hypothetical protein